MNKTYGDYVSIQKQTKADSYILQYEYEFDNWAHIKIDNAKTKNIKIEKNVNTRQDYRRE